MGKNEEGVDKKEEVQRKVEEEELVNKVAQLRVKTSGVLDQIFQTIKKEENLDKNEEIITRRREKNFDETKVLMRVGQTRGRGKGSGILEQVSDKNDGSFLRVHSSRAIEPSLVHAINFRKEVFHVVHF